MSENSGESDNVTVVSTEVVDSECPVTISKFDFKNVCNELEGVVKGHDWPVVYIITNEKEAYIGETCNVQVRMKNHHNNKARRTLKDVHVVFDNQANKSATLDMEQSLIRLYSADGKYKLQNRNAGQSASHDYYMRDFYVAMLPRIWKELKNRGLADNEYDDVCNSAIFKYSPYTALTPEQMTLHNEVLEHMSEVLGKGKKGTFIIRGSAGTGKTVMATSIMLALVNADKGIVDETQKIYGSMDEQLDFHEINDVVEKIKKKKKESGKKDRFKVGLVVPMYSLRNTLKTVFGAIPGLTKAMVISPSQATRDEYDVLVVDESHRLARYRNIRNRDAFRKACDRVGMDYNTATQLDWIVKCSSYQVLFYDQDQTVKGSDITDEQFWRPLAGNLIRDEKLATQLRCEGGDTYIDYITKILSCKQNHKEHFTEYDFRFFNEVDDMVRLIKRKNDEVHLCRCVAGYSWEWHKSDREKDKKKEGHDVAEEEKPCDIEIQGHRYTWNASCPEWILRKDSIDEIGCIHTTQGYDLNYVGVIFGREIDYDKENGCITINPELFFDEYVKRGADPETLHTYIINAYRVMLTRGIKGCYVYACNPGMAEYLRGFIDP